MGNYTNYVIRQNGCDRYYYWRGSPPTITKIFYGLERTLDWVDLQHEIQFLYRETYTVVIDYDRKVFLFWGNDFLIDHVAHISHLVEIMRSHTWSGWDVRWAAWGVFDVAEYLDIPISSVCEPLSEKPWTEENRQYHLQWWLEFDDPDVETVITHRCLDGTIADYITSHWVDETLQLGSDLLSILKTRSTVLLPHERDVSGCIYIDEITKTLDVWLGYPFFDSGIIRKIDCYWSGWNFCRNDGGYFEHLRKTGRNPEQLRLSREEAIKPILQYLHQDLQYRNVWNTERARKNDSYISEEHALELE